MKAYYIDVDGTLESKGKVSLDNVHSVRKAAKNGKYMVITTGRSYWRAKDVWDLIDTNDFTRFIICNNGSYIYDNKRERVIYEANISEETYNALFQFAIDNKYVIRHAGPNGFYAPKKSFFYRVFKLLPMHLEKSFDTNAYNNENSRKVGMIVGWKKKTQQVVKQLQEQFPDLEITLSGSQALFIEITPKGVSKATGAEIVSKIIEVELKDSAAIGDSMNDSSIFKVVGMPVAMKNADKNLKKIAKYETDLNSKSGVSKAIDYLEKEEN